MARKTDETPIFNNVDFRAAAGFVYDFRQPKTATLAALKGRNILEARTFDLKDIESMAGWIEQKNRDGYNIYFHVNNLRDECKNKKAKRTDVVSAHAFHVDLDDLSDEALNRILAFPIKPTCILCSGGGFQVFWLLAEPLTDIDKAEQINAALAKQLGGDACQNADRIMRVPETVNWPNAKKQKAGRVPIKAYLLREHTDFSRTHHAGEFEEVLRTSSKAVGLTPKAEVPDYSLVPVQALEVKDPRLIAVIETGDDPDNPRGSANPRFPSRSEAYYSVCCSLARRGCTAEEIAGVILNPDHGISEAIHEKPNPKEYAYRQAEKAVAFIDSVSWPEVYQSGQPKPGLQNALHGLDLLGFTYSNDLFHNRKTVNGYELQDFQGNLTDDGLAYMRKLFVERFGFDPGKQHLQDALQIKCLENSHHPIKDYFDSLKWDGVQRLEKILIDYFDTEDTPLNRAIGLIFLVAGVRRIKNPGCKFDTMIVLEGGQGTGKSTALVILAGEENFSDQSLFGQSSQQQAEALEGVMIYEVAELSGLKHSDISTVKAFITRTEDRLRPAYGRYKERWPRQCIMVGTTNDETYLKDDTGNRRFLPVKTGKIDLKGLARDRDQLFAEAVALEAKGFSITLPKKLWAAAAIEQRMRLPTDPWLDTLANVTGSVVNGVERISSADLLGADCLNLPASQQHDYTSKRIAQVMRELGWEGPKSVRIHGKAVRGYSRKTGCDDDPQF